MKITLPGRIARLFGYELVKLGRMPHRDINVHLLELFRLLDINCVLDVGANMGQYAIALRQAGYRGQILSFEPLRDCYAALYQRRDERWHVFNYALGSSDRNMEIHVARKNVFSSFLPPNQYARERFRESSRIIATEQVTVKKLDSVFDGIVPVSAPRLFLKLDTQGYDLEVLKGAKQVMPFIHGLQSELSSKAIYAGMPTHIESLKFIDELGYEITDIFPLSHDKHDMTLLEFDCIFRRKSKV